jgi:hypothetical protein
VINTLAVKLSRSEIFLTVNPSSSVLFLLPKEELKEIENFYNCHCDPAQQEIHRVGWVQPTCKQCNNLIASQSERGAFCQKGNHAYLFLINPLMRLSENSHLLR